ncbi:MAG: hypothetical protein AAF242_08400 [Bacteroidota bacterium]
MQKLLLLFGLISLCLACSPRLQKHFISGEEVIYLEKAAEKNTRKIQLGSRANQNCGEVDHYIPKLAYLDHFPTYTVRVNFHFIDTKDRKYNYQEAEAKKMLSSLMGSANKDLRENNKVWLPYGNDFPVLPIGYQMKLWADPKSPGDDGIYFHQDDEWAFYVHKGRNRNLHRREVINKYQVGADSIMNIFILPHHPDSVLSSTYHVGSVGVYLGSSIKMAGMFELQKAGWAYRGVLNHEMCHGFGLNHAWRGDGCDDTPTHNNECWNRGKTAPCDTAASNNIMDYNAYQNAWSPCQVGRVRRHLADLYGRKRNYIVPHWNTLDTTKNIVIQDSIFWGGAKDLKGNLTIASGATLVVACRLGMPINSKITIQPGGTLRLEDALVHHPGEKLWQGIEIEEQGKDKGKLIVVGQSKIENLVHDLALK